jgi:three-Cys-motif partner protein
VPAPIDKVGPWTEVKIEIVREYAAVFQKIVKGKAYSFRGIYMDGFSGAGIVESESRGGVTIESTPGRIVKIEPPFDEYHFIELEPTKMKLLRSLVGDAPNVTLHAGDSNKILLETILPTMTYQSFRKGLLFLDPYGMHLDWAVVEAAGESQCVDLLLNFPIMDMNRRVLRTHPSDSGGADVERMTRFFGDKGSWWNAVYEQAPGLFGPMPSKKKPGNEPVVEAYRTRLKEVAGFKYVSAPLAMTNDNNAVVYYLIGASRVEAGVKLFNSVFRKWRERGVRIGSTDHN